MAPKIKFGENEKVLCFHGPLLYEAKCIKHELGKDKVNRYYIHYNGWNKHWDEWVPESRVLKCNEAGLTKQRELHKAHLATKKTKPSKKERDKVLPVKPRSVGRPSLDKSKTQEKEKNAEKPKADKQSTPAPQSQSRGPKPTQEKGRSSVAVERAKAATDRKAAAVTQQKSTPQLEKVKATVSDRSKQKPGQPSSSTATDRSRSNTPTPTSDAQKRKRARLDATIESEESFMTKVEVKVTIPEELRPWLVDDWDLVTRQKNLVSVPCKKSVDDILDKYVKYRTLNTPKIDPIIEVTNGIREYFNIILGTQLLWKFERPQYGEILCDYPNKPMSSLYGATHLLRLFVRLGGMLVYTTLDEKTMPVLLAHIHDFLDYFKENASTLLLREDYVVAPPEYHRKAI